MGWLWVFLQTFIMGNKIIMSGPFTCLKTIKSASCCGSFCRIRAESKSHFSRSVCNLVIFFFYITNLWLFLNGIWHVQLFKAGVWPGSLVLNFTLNTSANTDCFRLSCCCVVQQFIRASQAFGVVPYVLMSLVVLKSDQTYTLRAWIQTFNIVIIFLRFSGC